MNSAIFHQGVSRAYRFYSDNSLLRQVSTLSSFKPSDQFKRLCFSSKATYFQLFLSGLSTSQFNFQLTDYSFFQFSFNSTTDLRYAFYPSPFNFDTLERIQELEEEQQSGFISFEEFSQELEDLEPETRRPVLRFEYNEAQYKKYLHPSSHLHMGLHPDNRFPVERLLSPTTFALLIAKLYFPTAWQKQQEEDFGDGTSVGEFDKMLMQEKSASPLVATHLFTAHERKLLFVS